MSVTQYFLQRFFPAEFTTAAAAAGVTVEIYGNSGTYIQAINQVWVPQVNSARENACRRVASFACGAEHLGVLRVMGRMVKILDDGETVFFGYIDRVGFSEAFDSRLLRVECRDKAKKFLLAGFDEDTTFEDLTASDTQRAHSAVSATSNIAAGGQIQSFAVVSSAKLHAIVLGLESEVTPDSVSGDLLKGTYSVDYDVSGLTRLRLAVEIDLRVLEAVQAVVITTNGTAANIQTSQDGLAWGAYSAGTSFRYLRFDVIKANGPITAGVTVTTSAAYSPANVSADNNASWRPLAADLDRMLTIDLGSAVTCNVVYLRWGINSLDRASQFKYRLERSTDGSGYTLIGEYEANASFLAEHLFDTVSMRYLRITALSATGGLFSLRYVDVRLTTSTVSIDTVIGAIAASEGETSLDLTSTRRYVAGGAVTFEAGAKKWDAMSQLARSIGFEIYCTRAGVLTLRARDKYITASAPEFTDVHSLEAEISDDEVYNQVIAVYESKDTSLRSVVQDGDALSPTGVPRVGTRTAPVIKAPLADTQAKLDAFALAELQRVSRQRTAVGFDDQALSTLEVGDAIRLVDSGLALDAYYVAESFSFAYTHNSKLMACEVTPL